jgi:probable F420-dependent oxidoreductase
VTLQIGAAFPQGGIELDAGAVRAYAEAVHDLGYRHVLSFDHVLGADPDGHPGWDGPFSTANPFHELFVLFGYFAACAPGVELCSGVLVLPQRQTALVAKQAAEVDVLTGGRFRLGVGTGWNTVEYTALGESWSDRGARLDEQIAVLRSLWSSPSVTFSGRFHEIPASGITPLPVQRPIPIWIGGSSERALRRAAELGDGYLAPRPVPDDPESSEWPERLARVHESWASRGHNDGGIDVRPEPESADQWEECALAWEAAGATHLTVTTSSGPTDSVDVHIAQLERVRAALGSSFST